MSFSIQTEPLVASAPDASPSSGACVAFEGRVRNHNDGKPVQSLEYEAFEELAVPIGLKILEKARGRFEIESATCVHRVGSLAIGDIAIRVEVHAAHRKAAFEACAWIVDEVKRQVPIWKKEFYEGGGSVWIDPTGG